jgi:hypothetical protein
LFDMKTLSRGWVLLLLAFPTSIPAQSTAFTYQGRLLDSGQPANGNYDLQFALMDAAIGGNRVGAGLTNAPTVVSNGLFVAVLDFGAAGLDGAARWLEIGARTNGSSGPYTLLSPRLAITAMPYAVFANAAATARVATTLTAGAVIAGNGAGITNLNGLYIQPGTINSNNLDAATAAQLALAGTGGGGLTSGSSRTGPWASYRPFSTPPYTVNLWEGGTLSQSGLTVTNTVNSLRAWGLLNNPIAWICLDEGWQYPSGGHDANHYLTPDPGKFPTGVKPVADYLHSQGLKLGLYLSFVNVAGVNNNTYPEQEAQSLCSWGVDYIKFDGAQGEYIARFCRCADSNYMQQGRSPMFINTHAWRQFNEPFDAYMDPRSKLLINSLFDAPDPPSLRFADMMSWLVAPGLDGRWFVSGVPQTAFIVTRMFDPITTVTNARGLKAEMSVMAMLSSEMQLYFYTLSGDSLAQPPDNIISAMQNPDVLAIDRDPAQVVGWPIVATATNQVWIKPLGSAEGPEWAVALCNLLTDAGACQSMYFSLTNLPNASRLMSAKELWSGETSIVSDGLAVTNWPGEAKLYRLTPYRTAGLNPFAGNVSFTSNSVTFTLHITNGIIQSVTSP